MRLIIIPGLVELNIEVDPAKKVKRKGSSYIAIPWMFAPWPESKEKGAIEIEIEGATLRDVLSELSVRYKRANVDFEPINPKTNDVDFDYDIIVNSRNYVGLPGGLDSPVKRGDRLTIKINRWDH